MPHGLEDANTLLRTDRFCKTDQASFLSQADESHYPESWYLLCPKEELSRSPVKKEILGKNLVVFLTKSNKAAVMENRCVHMGSELSNGCVIDETIQCSLHNWQFRSDGLCTHIPALNDVPFFAKQVSYPTEVRHGQVFFFNGPTAHFPLPFFDELSTDDLHAAKPFVYYVDCPWYVIGANAVDVQHFSVAHDRQMIGLPVVDHPTPFTHRTLCRFTVKGNSLLDKLTRKFGGPIVTLKTTDWRSTMLFTHSTLDRTETFGMLCIVPIHPRRTKVHITIMARRSQRRWRQLLFDPIRARIRRLFIRKFLQSDVNRLSGVVYSPHTLIEIDRHFGDYITWLGSSIR